MTPVVLYDNAFQILSDMTSAWPKKAMVVPLHQALGHTLAEPVIAQVSLPPFPRAMMDGFAVSAKALGSPPNRLNTIASVSAGAVMASQVQPGQAVRIATGAPMPEGCDAVARLEWCETDGDNVTVNHPVQPGQSVQAVGEDGFCGDTLLQPGTVMRGEHLAVCQGFGVATISVYAAPKLALIVTGDELAPSVNGPLAEGQVFSVNDMFLRTLLQEDGFVVNHPVFVGDDASTLQEAVATAIQCADVVVTTGGVSVGHRDYTAQVLEQLGAEMRLRKVMMRPGSPMLAASLNSGLTFSLSGNPAAAFIQFESLLRPALRLMLGRTDRPFPATACLHHSVHLNPVKPVRIFRGHAYISGGQVLVDVNLPQSSGVISSLGKANCLVRLDKANNRAGDVVPIRWFRHDLQ